MDGETLSERLRWWRDEVSGLSYGKMADRMNEHLPEDRQVHRTTLHGWETQEDPRPSPDRIRAIIEAFPSMRLEWLLFGDQPAVKTRQDMEEKEDGSEIRKLVKEEYPKVRLFDASNRELFFELLSDYVMAFEDGGTTPEEKVLELARDLLFPIRERTEAKPGFKTAGEDRESFNRGVRLILAGQAELLRGWKEDEGSVEDAPGALSAAAAEAWMGKQGAAREALSD